MNLYQAIFSRHSVRTFTGERLPKNITDKLNLPKTDNYRIVYVDSNLNGSIGSYGIIRNAPAWLALITDGTPAAELRCAIEAERTVLWMTSRNIASCWVGGTFNAKEASKKIGIDAGERLVAVIPIGFAAAKKRLIERITSAIAGSAKRKPFESLFSIPDKLPEIYRKVLEAVRMAPSAVNAQPWRINVDKCGDAVFSSTTDNSYTMLDMGIAISHFMIAAEELGLKGHIEISDNPTPGYIARWFCDRV